MVFEKKNKILTIAIPNYNYAFYIDKTISSVLKQPGNDFELLIADNNSNDKSWEIISSYKDDRLKCFRHSHTISMQENRNYLLKKANGKYFLLLPSDDYLDEDFIECLIQSLNDFREIDLGSIIWGYGNYIKSINRVNYFTLPDINGTKLLVNSKKVAFKYRAFSPPWAHAQNTKLLQNLGGYKLGSRRLDSLLFNEVIFKNPKTLVLKKILSYQTVHEFNTRHLLQFETIIDNIEISRQYLISTKNIFNRLLIRLFLSKNTLVYLFTLNKNSNRSNIKLKLVEYLNLVLFFPILIIIFGLIKFFPYYPFKKLNKIISI